MNSQGGRHERRESGSRKTAHEVPYQGHLVESADPAALAAILGGYTNAAEQCAGVQPGEGRDADNTAEGIAHQDAELTLEIARGLTGWTSAKRPARSTGRDTSDPPGR